MVELAIVVAIVGVLAVIAVVAYRKYMLHAKITEAQGVISAIRIAQEDHKAERGTYADLGAAFCPTAAGLSDRKVGWDPSCGTPTWATLPVHVDGPVQFQYATASGTTTLAGSPLGTTWVTWNPTPLVPWYVVVAKCDLDGNTADFTELASSSYQNTIFARNEGQ